MKKLLTLLALIVVSCSLWAGNVITYTASEQLAETASGYGLHTGAFNVDIVSHTFADGVGTITFSGDVTSIGYRAFFSCGMTSIEIPNSVTSIGSQAFRACGNLSSITIPSGVTSIGTQVFSTCSKLSSIIVESGNTVYDSRNNCNAIIETASGALLYGCKNTLIPKGVTSIGDNAMEYCPDLKHVEIPRGVKTIGAFAFRGCSYLKSVTFPEGLTTIGSNAFEGCSMLASIAIPSTVTTIGSSAFQTCGLRKIVSNAVVPPSLGTNVFQYVSHKIPLYVPASSISLYQAAEQWGEFDIQPILVEIDPVAPQVVEMTWNPVDSASLYQLHLYTDSTSSVALDTTLLINADSLNGGIMIQSGSSVPWRVKNILQGDHGTIIVVSIDPTSGTSENNPYRIIVSTESSEEIKMYYTLCVYHGNKLVCEEYGSFILNEKSNFEAIENVYIPSLPVGIYDLYGHWYSAEAWESLPAGVYVVRTEDRVEKVMKK